MVVSRMEMVGSDRNVRPTRAGSELIDHVKLIALQNVLGWRRIVEIKWSAKDRTTTLISVAKPRHFGIPSHLSGSRILTRLWLTAGRGTFPAAFQCAPDRPTQR